MKPSEYGIIFIVDDNLMGDDWSEDVMSFAEQRQYLIDHMTKRAEERYPNATIVDCGTGEVSEYLAAFGGNRKWRTNPTEWFQDAWDDLAAVLDSKAQKEPTPNNHAGTAEQK